MDPLKSKFTKSVIMIIITKNTINHSQNQQKTHNQMASLLNCYQHLKKNLSQSSSNCTSKIHSMRTMLP
jgi:hypothetical protein